MASPNFRINGGAVNTKASVAAGSAVSLALDSTAGVRQTTWTVEKTDETTTAGSITLTPAGAVSETCTFTAPAAGKALVISCTINAGVGADGNVDYSTTRARAKVYVPTATAALEVGCAGEEYESDATYGATGVINAPIRYLSSITNDEKPSARLATTANMVATRTANTLTADANGAVGNIDGLAVILQDRVLFKDQTSGADNGIYRFTDLGSGGTPWVAVRVDDFDSDADVTCMLSVRVERGTVNGERHYLLTTPNPIVLNTTVLTFERIPSTAEQEKLDAATTLMVSDVLVIRDGSGVIANDALTVATNLTPGLRLQNSTAAAAGAQQYSPAIQLTGHGWETDAGGLDNVCHWYAQQRSVQGTSEPSNELHFLSNTGGAGVLDQIIFRSFVGVGGVSEMAAGAGRWLGLTSDTAMYCVAPVMSFLAETGASVVEFRAGTATFRANTSVFKQHTDNIARMTCTWGATGAASAIDFGVDSETTISQTTRASDDACLTLTLRSQAPNAGATGGNRTPGTLALVVPAAVGGGAEGKLSVSCAGAEVLSVTGGASTAVLWQGAAAALVRTDTMHATGASSCTWAAAVTSVTYSQADLVTNNVTAATFKIQAQNETGTTSTGGKLELRSGTGTTGPGNIALGLGATDVATLQYNGGGDGYGTKLELAPFAGVSGFQIGFASGAGAGNTLQVNGQASTAAAGGDINIWGGATTGAGTSAGDVEIRGGAAGQAGGGVCGDVRIIGGNGVTLASGGNVILTAGAAAGASTNGYVALCQNGGTVRIKVDDVGIGFFAATPIAKPAIVGAKGGNAALTDLLTQLANFGLITDSTT